MKNLKKEAAFTLAEVLITLAIIGVVAAITIPILANSIQTYELQTRAKNIYQQLSYAVEMMDKDQQIWDKSDSDFTVRSTNMKNEFKKYIQSGEDADDSLVFASSYANYKNSGSRSFSGCPALKFSNGAYARFYDDLQGDCLETSASYTSKSATLTGVCGGISVDLNGTKQPNTIGVDYLSFWIFKTNSGTYQIAPFGSHNDGFCCSATDSSCGQSTGGYWGYGCSTNMALGQPLP